MRPLFDESMKIPTCHSCSIEGKHDIKDLALTPPHY